VETFSFVRNLYQQTFSVAELQEILLSDIKGENIFFCAMKYTYYNDITIQKLWNLLQEVFKGDSIKLKELLMQRNKNNQTVFKILEERGNKKLHGLLWVFVNKEFTSHEKLKIEAR